MAARHELSSCPWRLLHTAGPAKPPTCANPSGLFRCTQTIAPRMLGLLCSDVQSLHFSAARRSLTCAWQFGVYSSLAHGSKSQLWGGLSPAVEHQVATRSERTPEHR